MKIISVLDTSIGDSNMGNQIIMDSVNKILNDIYKEDFLYKLQFAEAYGKKSLKILKSSDYIFFGGTNSLSSQMNKYTQMGFSLWNLFFIDNVTLLGLGWWQYQKAPNLYTRLFLKRLLSSEGYHSVRDNYTKNMLEKVGIKNVLNTSCPTTWNLSVEHCKKIPMNKSSNVITTLTDYNKSPQYDTELINLLLESYEKVFYWIQGVGDKKYVNSLNVKNKEKLFFVAPKLSVFDSYLDNYNLDYIGTRLHAGIRALQKKKRTLVIAIDNRAKEISKDIGLNITQREDIDSIKIFIQNPYITNINIPIDDINQWQNQYRKDVEDN